MQVLSVSEFVNATSDYLEMGLGSVAVEGEVTGFRISKGRLIYFELKDNTSRVLCFAIKGVIDESKIADGQQLRVLGRPKLFKGTGGFHLHLQEVVLVGEGALQRAFEELKQKLFKEGVFDEAYKKPLPRFPRSIGLITAHGAAAYNDVLVRLEERWGGLEIHFAPVGVQGLGSVSQIINALTYINTQRPVDVIILTRGGGSLEDLQSFNDERVVRAVFASNIPVVVGVGHERDITLAELAADARASTPTNAAELVVPHQREIKNHIDHLVHSMTTRLEYSVQEHMQLTDNILDRVTVWFERTKERVEHYIELLHTLSPQATLKRGYSITLTKGDVVSSIKQLSPGDEITTKFNDGEISSTVN